MYCSASTHGYFTHRTIATKPEESQRRNHDRRARDRHGAALARRARRAEIGEGDDGEDQRIDRREDPVVQFGAHLAGQSAWFFADRCPAVARQSGRARRRAGSADRSAPAPGRAHSARISRWSDPLALQAGPFPWNSEPSCARGISRRCTLPFSSTRKVPRSSFTIVPCSPRKVARSFGLRRSSTNTPSRTPFGSRSRIWKVRPRSKPLKRPGCTMLVTRSARTSFAQSFSVCMPERPEPGADHGHHRRYHDRHDQERPEQRPGRHAGGIHHDQFRIVRQPSDRMHHRDHQRDRCDHEHQHRNDQAGDAEKDQHGLTAAGHQVDVAQRLRDPDDRSQTEQHDQERTKSGAEDVAADRAHHLRRPPAGRQKTKVPRPRPKDLRVPLSGRVDGAPHGPSLCSIHTRFTKWPSRGKAVENASKKVNPAARFTALWLPDHDPGADKVPLWLTGLPAATFGGIFRSARRRKIGPEGCAISVCAAAQPRKGGNRPAFRDTNRTMNLCLALQDWIFNRFCAGQGRSDRFRRPGREIRQGDPGHSAPRPAICVARAAAADGFKGKSGPIARPDRAARPEGLAADRDRHRQSVRIEAGGRGQARRRRARADACERDARRR